MPIDIERAALRHAFGAAEGQVAEIPPAARPGTIGAVAQALGIRPSEVRTTLELHWLESSGRAGARSLNGQARATEAPKAKGQSYDAVFIQIMGRDGGPTHNAQSVHAQFAGEEATQVKWEQPLDFDIDRGRKNRALDEALPKGKVGEYGQVPLERMGADDPLLGVRVYRGIGARDPAQVALRMTGHLIPEGTSGDYEHFKTYDHRAPLDAYEWTLDPFIAAKGAGGRGTLLSMTLGELKAQGAEVYRKRGDTEGGVFIASVVAPEHRVVANTGDTYRLSLRSDVARRPAQAEAATKLRAALVRHKGWEGLWSAQPAFGAKMAKARATETERLIRHWLGRLDEKAPNDPVATRVAAKLAEPPAEDPRAHLHNLERLLRSVALRASDLLDRTPEQTTWDLR